MTGNEPYSVQCNRTRLALNAMGLLTVIAMQTYSRTGRNAVKEMIGF